MTKEVILITKDDIRELWPLGKNINQERILPHIRRAQQSDLKPFLGEELYYDMLTNLQNTIYTDLLNGGVYAYQGRDIFFGGIKPLLVAWAFARIEEANSEHVTRGGNVIKETEQSEPMPRVQENWKARAAKSEALRLQSEAWQFLDQNRNTYPLWQIRASRDVPNRLSFNITKVHPRSTVQGRTLDDSVDRKAEADLIRYGKKYH